MYDLLSALIYWGISFVSITSQGFVSIRIVPVNCDVTVARGFLGRFLSGSDGAKSSDIRERGPG